MKNLKKIVIPLLFITLFYSCSKEQMKITSKKVSQINLNKSTFINPYLYIGVIHNKVLEKSLTNNEYGLLQTAKDKLIWANQEVIKELELIDSTRLISYELTEEELNFLISINPSTEENSREYFETILNKYDNKISSYVRQLDSILLDNRNEKWNENNFNNSMLNLNLSINNSNVLNDLEKKGLLMVTALGEKSFIFWNNGNFNDGDTSAAPPWIRDIGGFFGQIFNNVEIGVDYDPLSNEFHLTGTTSFNGAIAAGAEASRQARL